MPTYRLKCNKCNKEFEEFAWIKDRKNIKCSCGGDTTILISTKSLQYFKPLTLEHVIYDHPITVNSKKELKQVCEEHNVISPVLD